MLPKDKLREADVVSSLMLIALGAAVIIGACRMPMSGTYGGMPIIWYTSPGFFPLALGVLLVLSALAVFVRGCKDGAHRRLRQRIGPMLVALPRSRAARRILTIWLLLVGYVLCLAGHGFAGMARLFEHWSNWRVVAFMAEPEGANYVMSSFVFLALFMYVFYHRTARNWKTLSVVLAVSALVAWGIGYAFTEHLSSPLPW
jgi:hypothetical protein